MARSTQPRRFRLSLVGPTEDQPRLLRAYGKACDGEFALVMRPQEAKTLLVLLPKAGGAFQWRTDAPALPGELQATATVVRDGTTQLRIASGPQVGTLLTPSTEVPASLAHGDTLQVRFTPGSTRAELAGLGGDTPLRPYLPLTPGEAVRQIKQAQKNLPKPGPTTLRGRWSGTLTCDGGAPVVTLTRKLATYGTLMVSSAGPAGWSWRFERTEKWFSAPGDSHGQHFPTLSEAIEAGVLGAMSLVREACGFRDTRRRAAHDPAYADKHPIRAPKPMADPTERLARRAPRKTPPKRTTKPTPESIATWFDDNGFAGLAEGIRDYANTRTYPVAEHLQDLKRDLHTNQTVHDDEPDPELYRAAEAQLVALGKALGKAPTQSKRASSPDGRDRVLDRMPKEIGESAYTYARRLLMEASARAGEGHHRVARELLKEAERQAAGLSASKAQRIYERVEHVEGKMAPKEGDPQISTDEQLLNLFRQAMHS